jgi:hypothetical protein
LWSNDARFAAFYERNPDFDVRAFHFHSAAAVAGLDLSGLDAAQPLAALSRMQRLLDLANGHESMASALERQGFHSASHIARLSLRHFSDRMAAHANSEETGAIYARAKAIKASADHLFANVKALIGSPYYRATRFQNVGADIVTYFESLPSYQALFGRLDYLACEHCRSIFGPTAYFVDLMRVTDEYVTYSNRDTIPVGMKLEERRPDLFDLPLTCESADTVVPYLQIVNEVLAARIAQQAGADALEVLATAPYPWNLPMQAPLEALRAYLAKLETTLLGIYRTLPGPASAGKSRGATADAITLAADASDQDGWYLGMEVVITKGSCAGDRRRIVGYDGQARIARVDRDWTRPPGSGACYVVADTVDVARERLVMSAEQMALVTTPGGDANSVGARYGYVPPERIGDVLGTWTAASGTLSFESGSTAVVGQGTQFRVQAAPGTQILAAGEIRTVTAVTSETALTVDAPWNWAADKTPWSRLPWAVGQGTIAVSKDSAVVTGAGTSFDTTVLPGDQLQFGQTVRTVQSITSPTSLVVDRAYGAAEGPGTYGVNPVTSLDRVEAFLSRTGLAFDTLAALLREELSDAELASPVGASLYVDATGEGLPAMSVYADRSDPAAPVQRVRGLSLRRLDRMTRFVRLQSFTGWTPGELDWVIRASRQGEITLPVIETVAGTMELAKEHSLAVEVVSAFFADLKTIGIGDGPARADLFDRVFNDPALLGGKDPYRSTVPMPFDPARPLVWTIDDRGELDEMNPTIRARLAAALGIDDDSLTTLALWTAALQGGERRLTLDLATLSSLYRIAVQARAAQMTVPHYLSILWLLFFPRQGPLPPKGAVPATLGAAAAGLSAAGRVRRMPLSVPELLYVLEGVVTGGFSSSVTPESADALVAKAAQAGRPACLLAVSFVFETIDPAVAGSLVGWLVRDGFISVDGIVRDEPARYDSLETYFLLTTTSFVTSDISEDESKTAYALLCEHAYLTPTAEHPEQATLAESFSGSSPLDFLFASELPSIAELKRAQVRDILLQTKRIILHTCAVLDNGASAQDDQTVLALSEYFQIDAPTLLTLLALANGITDLAPLRLALLTPGPATDWLRQILAKTDRDVLWAQRLGMSPVELAEITGNPTPFAIDDPQTLDLAGIEALCTYRELVTSLEDTDNELLQYFKTDEPAARTALLCRLTGWSASQIDELVAFLWPTDSGLEGAAVTVAGVHAMRSAFDLGASAGVDIAWLISLVQLRHLPVGSIGGPVSETDWATYEQRAGEALSMVAAHVGDESFAATADELTDTTNEQARDGLLPYSIWQWSLVHPSIRSASDLYQLLLLDVEMGKSAKTSRVAQGMGSVQLYLQRARMNLEPGIAVLDIDLAWWSWLGAYRAWEANRKIFLYPENYLDPGLRSSATPLFKELTQAVSQTDLSEASLSDAFIGYFNGLSQLAELVPVGAYHATADDGHRVAVGGIIPTNAKRRLQPVDTLFCLARTAISPYVYYARLFDERYGWSAWSKVDLTIDAPYVAPLFAFDRLFIFWATSEETRSSSIAKGDANSQFFTSATLRYSFMDVAGRWVQPQVLESSIAIDVGPMSYDAITGNPGVQALYDTDKIFWQVPYPLRISQGILGGGTVTITEGLPNAAGKDTAFKRDVRSNDLIYAGGEWRRVRTVADDDELVVDEPWRFSTQGAQYRILRVGERDRPLPPFAGTGKVTIVDTLPNVSGVGTQFLKELTTGGRMSVGDQVRTVRFIKSNTEIVTMEPWSEAASQAGYTVFPADAGAERIVVLFGPPVGVGAVPKFSVPPRNDLSGADPFLVSQSELNYALFNALTLARNSSSTALVAAGDVSILPGFWLDANLNCEPGRILAAQYDWSGTNNPRPYRLEIDRTSLRLRAAQSASLLSDNCWGDSAPSGSLPAAPGASVDLLFNIAPSSAVLLAVGNQPGWWIFDNGDESFLVRPSETLGRLSSVTFSKRLGEVSSDGAPWLLSTGPYSLAPKAFADLDYSFTRMSTRVVPALTRRIFAGGVANLLQPASQLIPELPFNRFYFDPQSRKAPPHVVPPPLETLDFDGAYGAYFDELFLFNPWYTAEQLRAAQQFQNAKTWYEYVFNPTAPPDDTVTHSNDRYWRYLPFRRITLPSLYEVLTNPVQIAEYNDNPFDADAIAQLRTSAYAKAVVLRYIDNLIAWGDSLFAEDTRESIDAATQVYVLASDLLGERPKVVGHVAVPAPTTFREIRDHYGEQIPQFLIDLENDPIVRAQTGCGIADSPINDIQSYFCVPENASLVRYWDVVEDRLYKIRHSMNLQGTERALGLYARPLAVGPGGSTGSTGGGPSGIPYYRFSSLLDRAKSVVSDVASFGNAVLSALQSKDSAELLLLQTGQQRVLLDLTTQMKEQAVVVALANGKALEEQRLNADLRTNTYKEWIDKGLNASEIAQLVAMTTALVLDGAAVVANTVAAIAYMVPQVGAPTAMTYGGIQTGNSASKVAATFEIGSLLAKFAGEVAQLTGGWARREQEWDLAKRLADNEKRQAVQQIAANDANIEIARRDLQIHLKTLEQNAELDAFMRRQFTNDQLFAWMAGRLAAMHFQAYLIALETARAVERSFQYELDTSRSFIPGSLWDSQKKGLLAGEGLLLALDQMEHAYLTGNERRLEIVRPFSLKQTNPKAFLDLKSKGECMFELSERLFDADYPGHYARKIKAVAVTITAAAEGAEPAPVGPINASLVQIGNQTVLQPKLSAVSYLLGKAIEAPGPEVLRSNVWTAQQIALTAGENATGMFDFYYGDDRYLPFEGTGAVSSWRLSMPQANNEQDLQEIDDVAITLSYTALDGGAKFRSDVIKLLNGASGGIVIGLRRLSPDTWRRVAAGSSPSVTLAFRVPSHFAPARMARARVVGVHYQMLAKSAVEHEVVLDLANGRSLRFTPNPAGAHFSLLAAAIPASLLYEGEHKLTLLRSRGAEQVDVDDIALAFVLDGEVDAASFPKPPKPPKSPKSEERE